MTLFLKINLIAHVVFGLLAIILFYGFLIGILKNEVKIRFLKLTSLWGAVLFFASWISGGYYYFFYYGQFVRPVIKAGPYPWVHNVLMESKEHLFLFLPFLAAVAALAVWLKKGEISEDRKFKKALVFLALIIVILGTAVTVMGFAVSAAAR